MENIKTKKILYIGEHLSGKTKILTEHWLDLVNNDLCKSEDITIFVRNKTHENIFRENILKNLERPVGNIKIFRFRAYVNQIITKYWFYLFKNPPKYIGFSESIFMLREFLKNNYRADLKNVLEENKVKQGKFNRSLMFGIFERQQRIAENGLDHEELRDITMFKERSTLAEELNEIIKQYSKWLVNRDIPYLDYSLQLKYFYQLITENEIIEKIASESRHSLLIDDIDDSFYIENKFYESLWDKVNQIIYTGNKLGSMRQHLGSDINYLNELETRCDEVHQLNVNINPDFFRLGNTIFDNLTDNNHFLKDHNSEKFNNFEYIQSFQYGDMIEYLKKIPVNLKEQGYKASDVVFVTQNINEQLQIELEKSLQKVDWHLDTLKGSEILLKKPLINTIVTILRIIYYKEIKEKDFLPDLTSFDFSQLINTIGNTDNYYLAKLRRGLKNNPENWLKFFDEYSQKGFSTIKNIYDIIQYCTKLKNDSESITKYNQIITYIWQNLIEKNDNLRKYNNKSDFKIFTDMLNKHIDLAYENNIQDPLLDFLYCLINGEISDNPDRDIVFDNDCAKMISSQKLSELKIEFKIQIWIDISSESWNRSIVNPYVNPYLLLKSRTSFESWSSYEEMKLTEQKIARNIKQCLNLCTEKAYFLSADYNSMGEANNNDLLKNILEIIK